jgi:hypothetical protein
VHAAIVADPPELLDAVASRLSAFPPATGAPSINIELLADAAPEATLPPPAARARRLFEEKYEIDYYAELGVIRMADLGVVCVCDIEAGSAKIRVRDTDMRAVHLASHLFFSLSLLELLRVHGRYPLHAAGVSIDGRAVLIAGASGAGKSTLSLACARAGWAFLGDDVVLLRPDTSGQPEIRAFPDEIDLTDETFGLFGELGGARVPDRASEWEKRHVRPLDIPWIRLAEGARPVALVFPSRTRGATRLLPIDGDDAFIELVPSVVRTSPDVVERQLAALASLVRSVRSHRLEITDPFAAPDLLKTLLAAPAERP